jgi:hypothetical protein
LPSFDTFGPGVLEENSFGQVASEEKFLEIDQSVTRIAFGRHFC